MRGNHVTTALLVCGLVLTSVAKTSSHAAEGFSLSLEGGRGLTTMQTAHTFGVGRVVYGMKSLVMKRRTFDRKGGGTGREYTDYTGLFAVPFTFGLTDEVDVTLAVYGYNEARGWKSEVDFSPGYGSAGSGLGATRAGVKVRLPMPEDSRVQVAGTFGAMLATSDIQQDGINYRWTRTGTDIEASLYQSIRLPRGFGFHLQEGYVVSGTDAFDDQVVGAAGLSYNYRDRFRFSCELLNRTFLGVGPQTVVRDIGDAGRWYADNGFPAVGEPRFSRDDSFDPGEDYYTLTPSMAFRIGKGLTVDLGAIFNIADTDEPREKVQVFMGMTFTSKIMSMIDRDRDGVKNRYDIEPDTPEGYPVDDMGRSLDTDGDGVPDAVDGEPGTPAGAVVDSLGAGVDSDGDGVYDGIDREPATPAGCPVDSLGIALDGDGDGVPDGLDREPDTPAGAVVSESGVALDGDGDGVPDGLDREPDTPAGAVVSESGVALDGDSDGIPDGIDEEPDTAEGLLVDRRGRALLTDEMRFLRDGVLRMDTVHFLQDSDTLTEDSLPVLDRLGALFRKYPSLKIQIEGHTDGAGDPALNMRLARNRARTVLDYLLERYPDLSRERFRVVGFGDERPIASNATSGGRHLNRRVEFVVINRDELLYNQKRWMQRER